MTAPGSLAALAAAAIPAGFAIAFLLAAPAARRGLGPLHPAIVWLVLHAILFGVGSIALALLDGTPGPALYVAGAAVAAGLGAWLGDRLARRRECTAAMDSRRQENVGPRLVVERPRLVVERPRRRVVVPLLALGGIAAIVPVVAATGVPLLSPDVNAARTEVTGLPVQLVRVALPALAATWLLDTAAGRPPLGRPIVAWATLALALAFTAALANRYLPLELAAIVLLAWLLAGRPVPRGRALVAALLAAAVFVGFGTARATDRTGAGPVALAVERTVSRVFLVQPRTIAALQARIPSDEPYFLGATWLRRVGPALGRDIPNLGYWIYPTVVPGTQATAGYAAPGLLGEAWANFGPAGLGLFVLLGLGCERLGTLVAARRSRVVDVVAGSAAIVFVARTHALGLLGLALLLALVIAWRALAGADGGLRARLLAALAWRQPTDEDPVTAGT